MSLLIFDLDGTLVDSKADLAQATNEIRRLMGLPPLSLELVAKYVGNGAPVLVRRALGPDFSEAEVAKALEYFLTYYHAHLLDHTCLYPGVLPALDRFRTAGAAMAVLTNKPIASTHSIIEGLGLKDYFFRLYGGNSFEQKKPDPAGILALLAESGAAPEHTVMVGDSSVDIRTARNAAVKACGVSWGFQPEGFVEFPPDLLVNDLSELADYLLM